MFYRIELPYAVFGIETKNEIVAYTAPIAKWMIGKNIKYVKQWITKKNGIIQLIK